jgi:outer membrane protein TolC
MDRPSTLTEGEIGMRRNSALRAALAGLFLAGCHRPYFMTEADYAYYNRISGDYATRQRFDDIEAVAQHSPPTISNFGSRQEWQLSLQEAKHIALAANKRIAVLGFTPGERGTQIDTALSNFDANIGFGGAWSRTERQISNLAQAGGADRDAFVQNAFGATAQGTGQTLTTGGATDGSGIPAVNVFGLTKRNATGGISRFSYDLDYQRNNPAGFSQVNPSWNGTISLGIEQPLLQGAGVEFNRAPILIARAGMEQSVKEFETQVRTLLRDVENAYWQLYFSYQEVYSRKVGLELGLVLWQRAVDKLDAGSGNRAEVAQAREQFEFFKGNLITAENQLLTAEQELRRLLGVAPFDQFRLIPSDTPTEAQYTPDMTAAIHESMQLRPELAAQRFAVRQADLQLMRQKNGLLPDLSVSAVYGLSGLDNQFDQQFNRLFSNKYTEWRLGVRYQRQIGERAANAATRNAQLALSRERFRLAELEHETLNELGTAFREIERSFVNIEIQRQRRRAAAEQLESRKANYELGKDTLDVLVRAQSVYADALRDEAQAVVQYNQSLAAWEFAKGTILINDNVSLAEEICTNVPEAVREKVYRELTCARPLPIHPGGKVVPDTTQCPDTSLPLYKIQPADMQPSQIPMPLNGAGVNLKDNPLPPPAVQPAPVPQEGKPTPTLPANPPMGTPPSGVPLETAPKKTSSAEAAPPMLQRPMFQSAAPVPEPKKIDRIERTSVRPQIKAVATTLEPERRDEPALVLPHEPQPAELKDATPVSEETAKGWKPSQRTAG